MMPEDWDALIENRNAKQLDNIDQAIRDVALEIIGRCTRATVDMHFCDSILHATPIDAVLNDLQTYVSEYEREAGVNAHKHFSRAAAMLANASDCVVSDDLQGARDAIANAAKLIGVG